MSDDGHPSALYLVEMAVDSAAVFRLERALRVPPRLEDEGYLVHAALRRELGDAAPQPYALRVTQGRRMVLLGYAAVGAEALRGRLRAGASAGGAPVCDAASIRAKLMPERFPAGARFGFEVQVCPVIRRSSAGARAKAGAEVDAFLAECWRVGPEVPVDREEVYRRWLSGQLERNGARLLEANMAAFRRRRLLRRTQGKDRKSRGVERPDAAMRGLLEVVDAEAFRGLVARGVGRHRAFGFGMLLLRSVR